jgi:hypothetical protein
MLIGILDYFLGFRATVFTDYELELLLEVGF